MLDLEDLALGDGEAADLPGMADDDKIKAHFLVSAYPRGHRPAVNIMDILFLKPLVSLLPRNLYGIRILRKLDDGEFCTVRDLKPVLLRVEPNERPAVAVTNQGPSYRVERGCFHGFTSKRMNVKPPEVCRLFSVSDWPF